MSFVLLTGHLSQVLEAATAKNRGEPTAVQ